MPSGLHHVQNAQELLDTVGEDERYVYRSIFATDTRRQRRLAKTKLKLLRELDFPLRRILTEGEKVYFLTRGSMVSFWEGFFLGWIMYYLNRRAIILTNRRILLLQINRSGEPRELRAQIDYRAVERIRSTVFGNTRIRFSDGTTRVIQGVPKTDRTFLRERIAKLREAVGDTAPSHENIQDLCPHCNRVPGGADLRCEACGGAFKSPGRAALLSLVFPGAGDLYLGHKGFATLELLGAGLIWLWLLLLAWDPAISPLQFMVVVGTILLVIHGIDAVGTRHVARLGLYPEPEGEQVGGRLAAAAVVPLLVLAIAAVPLAGKRGLTAAGRVLPGDSVPERHVRALIDQGYLEPHERIVQFFAPGPFSILETGAILTDRRVSIYGRDEYESYFHTMTFDEIIDLAVQASPETQDASVLLVARDDGFGFWFGLPTVNGQADLFAQLLMTRWRAARAERGAGVWYDGGDGSTPTDAVVIRGLDQDTDPTEAQRIWLVLWYGPEGTDWTWDERTRTSRDGRPVDRVTVRSPSGERRSVFFEVGTNR